MNNSRQQNRLYLSVSTLCTQYVLDSIVTNTSTHSRSLGCFVQCTRGFDLEFAAVDWRQQKEEKAVFSIVATDDDDSY